MKRAYQLFLLLYPREHRVEFAEEMTSVFEAARNERHRRGWRWYARFALAEMFGLMAGAARAWLMVRPSRQSAPEPIPQSALPKEVLKAQQRVDLLIAAMVRAIANHQFEKARAHSNMERQAREKLDSLREKYGITD
jgi:hypothetical protein